jgi:hypothetical protein
MGLDIIAMDLPKDAEKPTDIPKSWVPPVIGNRQVLVDRIKKAIPIVEFVSPQSGLIIGDDFALEIHPGKEEACKSIHFIARGSEKAIGATLHILQLCEIRGIECAGTTFLDLDPGSADALRQWRLYLDRLVSRESETP